MRDMRDVGCIYPDDIPLMQIQQRGIESVLIEIEGIPLEEHINLPGPSPAGWGGKGPGHGISLLPANEQVDENQ